MMEPQEQRTNVCKEYRIKYYEGWLGRLFTAWILLIGALGSMLIKGVETVVEKILFIVGIIFAIILF